MTDEERRRRFLLNTYAAYGAAEQEYVSRIETVSGERLNFVTRNPGNLISLIADIEPNQAGSGTPSPSNIRPISGYAQLNITREGANQSDQQVYTISFNDAGTVYGGNLDVVNGVLTVDRKYIMLGALTWIYHNTYNRFQTSGLVNVIKRPATSLTPTNIMSDMYETSVVMDQDNAIAIAPSGNLIIYDHAYTDALGFSMARADAQIIYPLADPLIYNLTPNDIQTLDGVNNIYMDAVGTLTAQYRS